MSWIRAEAPPGAVIDADPEPNAGEAFAHLRQVLNADPDVGPAVMAIGRGLLRQPAPLSGSQAALIATVVSAVNGCGYCVTHFGAALGRALDDEALARAIARDYRTADLAARDRVLADFAVALTCEPSERTREDIERLREYGFDDPSVLRATELTGWINAVNRVASGLGIELEPGQSPWEFGSQR